MNPGADDNGVEDRVLLFFERPDLLVDRLSSAGTDFLPVGPTDDRMSLWATRTFPTVILREHCSDCIYCLETCPNLEYDEDNRTMMLNEIACKGCGLCISACPTGAMQQRNSWYGRLASRISRVLGHREPLPDHCNNCPVRTATPAELREVLEATENDLPVIRLLCSGRVETGAVLESLVHGCDAVFVCGCLYDLEFFRKNEAIVTTRLDMLSSLAAVMGLDRGRISFHPGSMARGEAVGGLDAFARKL